MNVSSPTNSNWTQTSPDTDIDIAYLVRSALAVAFSGYNRHILLRIPIASSVRYFSSRTLDLRYNAFSLFGYIKILVRY